MTINSTLRQVTRQLGRPILEIALPQAERLTGFRTAAGDYLPNRLKMFVGAYEAEELSLMRQSIRPGQTIIDAGANIGYTVRFFARAVAEAGNVYAFEPNPIIFPLLEKNVAKSKQVATFNLGLSSRTGEIDLFLAGKNHSVASFSKKYPTMHLAYRPHERAQSVRVKVVKGDEFVREHGIDHVDAIKIDVEGWELQVLAGFEETISKSPGISLFCEFSPAAQTCSGNAPRALLDWLWDHKFTIRYPKWGGLTPVLPDSVDQFLAHVIAHDYITIFANRHGSNSL